MQWSDTMDAVRLSGKMQSEIADFAPGPATWRTGQNIAFDSRLLPTLYKT